jgi:hypothetical protein
MRRKRTFHPKSKNGAARKSNKDMQHQTRMKPPHLPKVVPCGAANDHVLRKVLQPAPPGLLVGLDYQPPVAREVGHVKPPKVDIMEVVCHVYCLLFEVCPPPPAGGGDRNGNGGRGMTAAQNCLRWQSGGMRASRRRCSDEGRWYLPKAAVQAEMAVAVDIFLSPSSVIIVGKVFCLAYVELNGRNSTTGNTAIFPLS